MQETLIILFHTAMQRSYSDSHTAGKASVWRRGSTSDLTHSQLTTPTRAGRVGLLEGAQFTQSLSIPTTSQGAGEVATMSIGGS